MRPDPARGIRSHRPVQRQHYGEIGKRVPYLQPEEGSRNRIPGQPPCRHLGGCGDRPKQRQRILLENGRQRCCSNRIRGRQLSNGLRDVRVMPEFSYPAVRRVIHGIVTVHRRHHRQHDYGDDGCEDQAPHRWPPASPCCKQSEDQADRAEQLGKP